MAECFPASLPSDRKATCSGPPPAVVAVPVPAHRRTSKAYTKQSSAKVGFDLVDTAQPRKRASVVRFASKRSFEGGGVYRCVDRRLISERSITLFYGGQDYVDDTSSNSVAKMRRVSLLTNDEATMRDGKGNAIARLYTNVTTNTFYLFRNAPSYRRQAPVAQKNANKMFGDSGTKAKLYKFAKIEIGRNKATYLVAYGQTSSGVVVYKKIYIADLTQQDKVIEIKSSSTGNVVAKIRFDKYGASAVFHIEEGSDVAAIIALEQTVYAATDGNERTGFAIGQDTF
eukprot:CAMPEP_0197715092 /NCGR_PEP_ID=MMETSP1434-20131217/271_1 /TAXON_ID=265543 /ORGANISM="Minutocellus polymorphus, Strain CCMP3303" /LENGTH=284 /DNA_ID=CAMNT_0043299103 /DNA_START=139 /DNA_END=993 /DNA_ORIENTATION=+